MSGFRKLPFLVFAAVLMVKAPAFSSTGAPSSSQLAVEHIDRMLSALANVEIREKISRFAGRGPGSYVDSFNAEVSVVDGVEQYLDVKDERRRYGHVGEISGLWSFGEVFTVLRTTREILAAPGGVMAAGREGILFQTSAGAHRWFIASGRRIGWLGFVGSLQTSKTGDVERLTWSSRAVPAWSGIHDIRWDVEFHVVNLHGLAVVLPSTSVYTVQRKNNGTREWNFTEYTASGRYGATSKVEYEPQANPLTISSCSACN